MANSKAASKALADFSNVQQLKQQLPRVNSEQARESMREEMRGGFPHGVNPSLEQPSGQFPVSGQAGVASPFPPVKFSRDDK